MNMPMIKSNRFLSVFSLKKILFLTRGGFLPHHAHFNFFLFPNARKLLSRDYNFWNSIVEVFNVALVRKIYWDIKYN